MKGRNVRNTFDNWMFVVYVWAIAICLHLKTDKANWIAYGYVAYVLLDLLVFIAKNRYSRWRRLRDLSFEALDLKQYICTETRIHILDSDGSQTCVDCGNRYALISL